MQCGWGGGFGCCEIMRRPNLCSNSIGVADDAYKPSNATNTKVSSLIPNAISLCSILVKFMILVGACLDKIDIFMVDCWKPYQRVGVIYSAIPMVSL